MATITFFILRLIPGDPARAIAPTASQNDLTKLRIQLHLNEPILTQYWRFVGDVFHGNLGYSYFSAQTGSGRVFTLIFERLPLTVELAGVAILFALLLALPLGFLAGAKRNSAWDRVSLTVSVAFQSMPNFFVGLMLILFVGVKAKWLPATGYAGFKSVILPAIALALPLVAVLARVIRASLGNALAQEYSLALVARGIPRPRVVISHGARSIAVPTLTVLGVQMGYLLGGAVVIEYLFDFPGVGLLTLNAVVRRDYPLIQGLVLTFSTIFVLVNLLVDLAYPLLDPRIRRQASVA